MKMYMSKKEINTIFEKYENYIFQTDLVLVNGRDSLIGVRYNPSEDNAPRITMICNGTYTFFIEAMARGYGVPCYESKILVNAIVSSKLERGDDIPGKYWRKMALYFSKINNKSNQSKNFEMELNRDFAIQYRGALRKEYKEVVNKLLNTLDFKNVKISEVEKCLLKIADEHKYNFFSNANTNEYFLNKKDEYGRSHNYIFSIAEDSKTIYVGNIALICCIDINEVGKALGVLDTLIKVENSEPMKNCWNEYYTEFKINPKLLDIARSGIKVILEDNLKNRKIKYYLFDSAKTAVSFYLEKGNYILNPDEKSKKMYLVTITYNEYLRNPQKFKKFIECPETKYEWNFWCREQKYKEEYFQ